MMQWIIEIIANCGSFSSWPIKFPINKSSFEILLKGCIINLLILFLYNRMKDGILYSIDMSFFWVIYCCDGMVDIHGQIYPI